MDTEHFEVKLDEDLDLSESVVIVAFPTVGVVGPIAASFLVSHLELEHVGSIHSGLYPPAAVVRNGRTGPPIRLYAGEEVCGPDGSCSRVVILYSEVPPPEEAVIPMARAIVEWAADAKHLIVLEGMELEEGEEAEPVEGIASNEPGCDILDRHKVHCLTDGVVTGLAGALLNEGIRRDREVICLVAPAHKDSRDSEAATHLLGAVDRFVVEVDFDLDPLKEWTAEEGARIQKHAEKSARPERAPPMYG